ncbi:hypothetical protein [Nocardioides perillae]|uniref:Sulfotransferase family protein n=1 Tax=Nocardioides perillae TaxID=1119534 RepID=A0A7Y9US45_9ACTN|nr:hypothetical protein [Nocardioides perillae]NYG55229.1 hypothetical protein [Nocardioides perillae]
MASRVVLHVGLMKSGTSYLQQRLFAGRTALGAAGVLLWGEGFRDQVLAVSDVLERAAAGPAARGRWQALRDDVAAHPGPAVVSMEFLGPASPERIARVVGSLAPARVEVVLTLRDLGRAVPAMWSEALQHGSTVPWGEYAGGLAGGGGSRHARAFWRQQGAGRIVDNWVDGVGADAVSLVTVPPPGAPSDLLWERFCAAADLPPAACPPVPPANTSLDAASARVLLEVNRLLAPEELPTREHHREVKFRLAKNAMAGRAGAPGIAHEPSAALRERAARVRARLAASGARLVGDLADLEPVPTRGLDPDRVPDDQVARAAVEALARRVLLDVRR